MYFVATIMHMNILCVFFLVYRTGPLIVTWCMRMEGKNSYFKQIAQSSNFNNVLYTVAKRHQRLLSYLHGKTFFDKEVEYGPGIYTLCYNLCIYM